MKHQFRSTYHFILVIDGGSSGYQMLADLELTLGSRALQCSSTTLKERKKEMLKMAEKTTASQTSFFLFLLIVVDDFWDSDHVFGRCVTFLGRKSMNAT